MSSARATRLSKASSTSLAPTLSRSARDLPKTNASSKFPFLLPLPVRISSFISLNVSIYQTITNVFQVLQCNTLFFNNKNNIKIHSWVYYLLLLQSGFGQTRVLKLAGFTCGWSSGFLCFSSFLWRSALTLALLSCSWSGLFRHFAFLFWSSGLNFDWNQGRVSNPRTFLTLTLSAAALAFLALGFRPFFFGASSFGSSGTSAGICCSSESDISFKN